MKPGSGRDVPDPVLCLREPASLVSRPCDKEKSPGWGTGRWRRVDEAETLLEGL